MLGARLLSASVNFATNRRFVFDRPRTSRTGQAARRYAALAASLLTLNYLLLRTLTEHGLAALPAKLATELVLVCLSYAVQSRFVFASARRVPVEEPARPLQRR